MTQLSYITLSTVGVLFSTLTIVSSTEDPCTDEIINRINGEITSATDFLTPCVEAIKVVGITDEILKTACQTNDCTNGMFSWEALMFPSCTIDGKTFRSDLAIDVTANDIGTTCDALLEGNVCTQDDLNTYTSQIEVITAGENTSGCTVKLGIDPQVGCFDTICTMAEEAINDVALPNCTYGLLNSQLPYTNVLNTAKNIYSVCSDRNETDCTLAQAEKFVEDAKEISLQTDSVTCAAEVLLDPSKECDDPSDACKKFTEDLKEIEPNCTIKGEPFDQSDAVTNSSTVKKICDDLDLTDLEDLINASNAASPSFMLILGVFTLLFTIGRLN